MKLQHDMQKGLLSEEQYNLALRELKFKTKKKQVRPSKLSKDEANRRKSLRTITKWVFDIELDRERTPLYDDNKTLVLGKFLPLADQVIMYAGNDPVVAAEPSREALIQTITSLVTNRRKNLKDSKKTAHPMKLIYHKRKVLLVKGADGQQQVVGPPKALPLVSTSTSPRKKLHPPAVKTPVSSPIVSTTTPPPQVTALPTPTTPRPPPPPVPQLLPLVSTSTPRLTTTPVFHPPSVKTPASSPQVTTTTPPPQVTTLPLSTSPPPPVTTTVPPFRVTTPEESDDEFDILNLQEQLEAIQKRLKQSKQAKAARDKKKSTSWLTTSTTNIKNSVVKRTCRNSECGRDFEVSFDTKDQTFLCPECWEDARDELKQLTSSTGNPAKRKLKPKKTKTKKRKLAKKVRQRQSAKFPVRS